MDYYNLVMSYHLFVFAIHFPNMYILKRCIVIKYLFMEFTHPSDILIYGRRDDEPISCEVDKRL